MTLRKNEVLTFDSFIINAGSINHFMAVQIVAGLPLGACALWMVKVQL